MSLAAGAAAGGRLHGVGAVSRFEAAVCARSLAVVPLLQGAAAGCFCRVLLQGGAVIVRVRFESCVVVPQGAAAGCCAGVLLQGAAVRVLQVLWSLVAGAAAKWCCNVCWCRKVVRARESIEVLARNSFCYLGSILAHVFCLKSLAELS